MSLLVPEYPSQFSVNPISNAVAWVGYLAIDFSNYSGRIVVMIHADAASAQEGLSPINTFIVPLGNGFPSLPEILQDNAVHFNAIRDYIYEKLKALPEFANSVDV